MKIGLSPIDLYVIRTTSLRGTRYEVRHETRGMPNGAFDAQGLGSIPEIKLERRVGLVDSETLAKGKRPFELGLSSNHPFDGLYPHPYISRNSEI